MLNSCCISRFRILRDISADFADDLTVLSGPNGCGKTSILEAIYFASCGRSFRSRDTRQLVSFGEDYFQIVLNLLDYTLKAQYIKNENVKKFTLNDTEEKISYLSAKFPFFVFNSRSLAVVRGGKTDAYRFFNKVLGRLFPGYIRNLATYRKALINKRLLLKKEAGNDIIRSWNSVLEEQRGILREKRQWLIEILNDLLPHDVQIRYMVNHPDQPLDDFLKVETEKRVVVAGAHLDRYMILRGSQDVRQYSSSGQQKKVFFDLMTSVGRLFHQHKDVRPVLLLDDFDSEFDEVNMYRNLDEILGQFQVILTTTDYRRFNKINHHLVQLEY